MARDLVRRARRDVAVFADALVGEPLWPHQLAVLRSRARHRSICSGRQAGKSRTLAIGSLFEAFTRPGAFVLILSANETGAKDLLGSIAMLASSPLLAGSVVDENKSQLVLTNGSTIRSIPSTQRQARGLAVDLLIIDEACFVDDEVWQAAKYATIAKAGSRIILASTPWGRADRFFAVTFRLGQQGEPGYESFHWPSTVSPLVDVELLEQWRVSDPERVFRAEVLAEWVDAQGAYFTPEELDVAAADYELIVPARANDRDAVAGCDWGFAHDASTIVLLAPILEGDPVAAPAGVECYFVPYLEEAFGVPYSTFIDRVCAVDEGYYLRNVVSEKNGVGDMPTQELQKRLGERRVLGVHTTAALKEDAFGRVKALLQQQRLRLPRHPGRLRQLSALEYEASDSGAYRIAVPERSGHDDLAIGLALAVHGDPAVGASRVTHRPLRFKGASSRRTAPTDGWLRS